MSQLGSGENIWLIASLGLNCPPLLSGGLLAEREHLASSSVILASGLGRSQTLQAKGTTSLLAVQVLRHSEICDVPVVIQDFYCMLSPF